MTTQPSSTKELLLAAGQRLFASRGIHAVSSKEILAAAQQKNASALQYHFGGRSGLLFAILDRHNAKIEAERKELLDADTSAELRPLVEAMVLPFARNLETAEGREFLKIVAQLGDEFEHWAVESAEAPIQAQRALHLIVANLSEREIGLSPAVRHERATRFLALISEALGARARIVVEGQPALNNEHFVANLIDMSIGALTAPSTL